MAGVSPPAVLGSSDGWSRARPLRDLKPLPTATCSALLPPTPPASHPSPPQPPALPAARRFPRSEIHPVVHGEEAAPGGDVPGEGWEVATGRRRPRSPCCLRRPRRDPGLRRNPPPPPPSGECPRCFGDHPGTECRRHGRCRWCRFYGHIARNCTTPRPYSPSGTPLLPSACGPPPASFELVCVERGRAEPARVLRA